MWMMNKAARPTVATNAYHFAHFCKDSFGDTPRALRKRSANGEKISIICKEQGKDQEDE
jgi:hypothetical protein